jgi:hypothetical protein
MCCGAARRRCVVLLLLAGAAWAGRPAGAVASPTTRPATPDGFSFVEPSFLPEHRLTLLHQDDLLPGVPPTTQPRVAAAERPAGAEPRSIYDPLPPAFWSGLSLLVMAGAFLSLRWVRAQFR